ncbi:MAG: discoidin domain-containing protein [Candidatus Omnitrophica bacterium]|nr:discoidin domain-containing protein [Candidatus Omnitrophota bacterium]
MDGNGATFWESADVPTPGNPQFITVAFPYPLTINKVRFVAPNQPTKPKDYSWQVSSDNVTYSTVAGAANNGAADVTDTFVAQPNVNYLRLRVTQPGSSRSRVRISTLEAIGSKVTSTGTISSGGSALTRKVTQTLVADDGSPESQKAYLEPDWSE